MMDDAQLWQRERTGEPVQHCRDKIAADHATMIERRNRNALERHGRRPILRMRFGS